MFIGAAAFSAPAQLRYSALNGLGLLEGNVDANLAADFQIALAGAPNLTAGWVVLKPRGTRAGRLLQGQAGRDQDEQGAGDADHRQGGSLEHDRGVV